MLEDKTSLSHIRVTVSPSKMISGVIKNLVSSGNTKKKIMRIPKQINVSGATHQMPPPQMFSGGRHRICGADKDKATRPPHSIPRQLVSEIRRVAACQILGHGFHLGFHVHLRVLSGRTGDPKAIFNTSNSLVENCSFAYEKATPET